MSLRTGHGAGKGRPHIEVMPPDELPVGVPAPPRPPAARQDAGKLAPGPGTRELARLGGRARADSMKLRRLLGLREVPEGHEFGPYARLAREWRDEQMARLAALVGGGEVGPGPASIISSAALQLAASRYLSDRGAAEADPKLLVEASKLANDSRQNVLAAHEIVAKEATANRSRQPFDPLAAFRDPK